MIDMKICTCTRHATNILPYGAEDGAHKGRDHLARPGEAGELIFRREAFQIRHVDGSAL